MHKVSKIFSVSPIKDSVSPIKVSGDGLVCDESLKRFRNGVGRIRNILILDGERPYVVSVMRALGASQGWRIHLVSKVPLAPGRFSKHCAGFHVLPSSIASDEDYLASIREIAVKVKPDLLLCSDETGIELALRNTEELSAIAPIAPIPTLESFLTTCDKRLFAEHCKNHDLPHPKTIEINALDERAMEDLLFPLIMKPTNGGNGRGIHRVTDAVALSDFMSKLVAGDESYLAQEEIPGRDIDCSFFASQGKVLAATVQQPLFYSDVPFRSPAAIKMVEDNRVIELASKLASSLNWHGVAHVDMRYDERDDRLYLIEVNPRFWGSLTASVRAGTNFPDLLCNYALWGVLGKSHQNAIRFASGSMLRMCVLKQRLGIEAPLRMSELATADSFLDPGPAMIELALPDWTSPAPKARLRNGLGLLLWLSRVGRLDKSRS